MTVLTSVCGPPAGAGCRADQVIGCPCLSRRRPQRRGLAARRARSNPRDRSTGPPCAGIWGSGIPGSWSGDCCWRPRHAGTPSPGHGPSRHHDLPCNVDTSGRWQRGGETLQARSGGQVPVMPVLRAIARPMLASIFIIQGCETLLRPEKVSELAEPVVRAVAEHVSIVPDDTEQAVRISGAVQAVAGSLLALGWWPAARVAGQAAWGRVGSWPGGFQTLRQLVAQSRQLARLA